MYSLSLVISIRLRMEKSTYLNLGINGVNGGKKNNLVLNEF